MRRNVRRCNLSWYGLRAVLGLVVVVCSTFVNYCTPSVRYSRSGSPSRVVPRNWDYRSSYKVPANRLTTVIKTYLGTPYRSGGMSRRGVDCSGFVCLVFREVNRAELPRSTRRMRQVGRLVPVGQARAGDLVFFRGGPFGSVNHVGIYVGNRTFAHAAIRGGVRYDSLDEQYYRTRFMEIRRVF